MSAQVRHDDVAAMSAAARRTGERRARTVMVTPRGGMMLSFALVLFSVAYVVSWPELLILASFCAIPPLLALIVVTRRRPKFTIVRSTSPAMVSVGATGSARLTLHQVSRVVSTSTRWSDDLPWNLGRTPWIELALSHSRDSVGLNYDFVPPRRGVMELGPLILNSTDPFGLASGEITVGNTHRLVVAPESVDLGQALTELASQSGAARLFQHRALAGDHDIMTRDYRPGDALRHVHWKASAHHGELMVREDEKRSHAESIIFIDTRRGNWRDVSRTRAADRPDSERFEWALSMVSSLRHYLIRHGLRVSVIESAVRQLADAALAEEFVESLARVQLSYQDGPPVRLTATAFTSVSSIFAVLDNPDEETIVALEDQRRDLGLAVAFLCGETRADVSERLTRAGWHLHRVTEGESVVTAWQDAINAS